jgi:hypothetical protein
VLGRIWQAVGSGKQVNTQNEFDKAVLEAIRKFDLGQKP